MDTSATRHTERRARATDSKKRRSFTREESRGAGSVETVICRLGLVMIAGETVCMYFLWDDDNLGVGFEEKME